MRKKSNKRRNPHSKKKWKENETNLLSNSNKSTNNNNNTKKKRRVCVEEEGMMWITSENVRVERNKAQAFENEEESEKRTESEHATHMACVTLIVSCEWCV